MAANARTPTSCTTRQAGDPAVARPPRHHRAEHGAQGQLRRRHEDIELRGTGNLLGDEQSGHIEGVGFDLYVRMVSEAVEQYKEPGERAGRGHHRPAHRSVHPGGLHRFRQAAARSIPKLAASRTDEGLKELADELTDRYGKLPEEFETLFGVARLRMKRGNSAYRRSSRRARTCASARSTRPNRCRCASTASTAGRNTSRSRTHT